MKPIIAALLLCILVAGFGQPVLAESSVINIYASVPGCGDANIQIGEDCDGPNLNGQTCQSQHFSTGTLSCGSTCLFDTSLCSNLASPGGGGGNGYGIITYILPPFFRPPPKFVKSHADINDDGKVNLVDLSILLFYYHKSSEPGAKYDFNEDGKVDIVDVSILLYYWTG